MINYESVLTAGLEKLDAAFLAAIKTNFAEYQIDGDGDGDGDEKCIAVIIEATQTDAVQDSSSLLYKYFADFKGCRIAKLTARSTNGVHYYTADVVLTVLLLVLKERFVTRIQLCSHLKTVRGPTYSRGKVCNAISTVSPIASSSKKSIVATIDHGCPFAHKAFLTENSLGTRIFSIWDQDERPEFPAAAGTIPAAFGYGRQITQDKLNDFIASSKVNGSVNEELCYESAAYRAMRVRWTHGGASLGLLASPTISPSLASSIDLQNLGLTRQSVLNSDADIIFVQLPRSVPSAPTAGATDRSLLDGIAYIVASAGDQTTDITIVIDYGTYLGPHDGSSIFEKALDAIVDSLKDKICLTIVFASGNGYNKDVHARLKSGAPAGREHAVDWWVPPDNDSATFADIWLSQNSLPLELCVTSPGGSPIKVKVPSVDALASVLTNGDQSLALVLKPQGDQYQIFLQVASTHINLDGRPTAPSGRWNLSFKFSNINVADIDLYTSWGGRNSGFPQRMMPSKFINSNTQIINEYFEVTGNGSLIGSGCGKHTLVVGSYEGWGKHLRSEYSGAGFARGGKRAAGGTTKGVDVLAMSDESPSLQGILCIGALSGAVLRVNGTSFAAPQIGRAITYSRWKLPRGTIVRLPAPSAVSGARQEYEEPRFP